MKLILTAFALTFLASCGQDILTECEALDRRLESLNEMLRVAKERSDTASNAVESLQARGENVPVEVRAEFFASMANLQSAMADFRRESMNLAQREWDAGCFD